MLTKRCFRRKVEICSRWVWIHFRMSDTESVIKLPSSPLPLGEAEKNLQGPLISLLREFQGALMFLVLEKQQ